MILPPWRSLLFAPADNAERCAKAARAGADAVILDLEDGVAPAAKPAARAALADAAQGLRAAGVGVVVRLNAPWALAIEDLHAARAAGADALMVPKAQDPHHLAILAEIAADLGAASRLIALVESPQGVAALGALAQVPAVAGLALGTEDFSLAMGVEPDAAVLDHPSRLLALAAAARGQMALAVPFSIARFREEEAFAAAARLGAAYGVNGAICIHPRQVAAANTVFGISEEARVEAAAILAAWDEAQAQGLSVVSLGGRMIDLPVAERARRVLARR